MSVRMEHSPMASNSRAPQHIDDSGVQPAPVSFFKSYEEGIQSYNTSGLQLDLSRQPALEPTYSERLDRDFQHEKTPTQKTDNRSRGWRRSTFLLLAALITAIIITTVLGGIVGSLMRKENINSSPDSKHASRTNNSTAVVSRTAAFAQQSAASSTTSSPLSYPSSSSTDKITPIVTLGPSETYSIISSPTLTLHRDCPASNGTTVVTNDVPQQSFIKNCGWVYALHEPHGDAFQAVTTTLDACISLCAAYNVLNATGPLGTCAAVEWRTDLSLALAGHCFGNFDAIAGNGEPAGFEGHQPADAAFFLGWS